jgi:hypothetical protein
MKYLKLFESFNDNLKKFNESQWSKDDYYQEVPRSDYHSIRNGGRQLFSDDEKETIKEVANKKGFDFSVKNLSMGEAIRLGHRDDTGLIINSIKALHKFDDEWYMLVSYSDMGDKENELSERYYKCDGFEGLLKCLNDLL